MDIQKLMNVMSDSARGTRSNYHLTLGEAIKYLSDLPDNIVVTVDVGGSLNNPHSYRGYYSDLSFEPTNGMVTSGEFLSMLQSSLDKTFEGYKGGDFVMSENTPLWFSGYGNTGRAIMDIKLKDGELIIDTKDVD